MRYTFEQFITDFPSEEACFDILLKQRRFFCICGKECKYRVRGKKTLSCSCGKQVSPFKGTIFEKSPVPLRKWVFALYLFSQARNGISAEELRKQIGVTYKTAWRMGHKIRSLMKADNLINKQGFRPSPLLTGVIECDESWLGRRTKRGMATRGKGTSKAPVFGMVERGGRARAMVIPNLKGETLVSAIRYNLDSKSKLVTDDYKGYHWVGMKRYTINHSTRIYGRKEGRFRVNTNTIEGLWSHLKRHIRGTHVGVSKQHLQKYVDQAIFHYNHRASSENLFLLLLNRASHVQGV